MTILACLTKVNDFLINDCILDDLLTVCPLCPTPFILSFIQVVFIEFKSVNNGNDSYHRAWDQPLP